MGSSFVLFDVSMEITQRQFRSGKSGYTQKHRYPWENASYPWVKGLSVTLVPNVLAIQLICG